MRFALTALAVVLALAAPGHALELTSRSVMLDGEIKIENVRKAQEKLLELDDVSNEPIFLRINSAGGSVEAGFILIDTINAIRSPVYALVESKAYSMAAIITVFCAKRYILPHATLMFHEASYGTAGEDPTNRSRMEFNTKYLDTIHHEIAARLRVPHDTYRSRIRDGWWMLAKEAREAGVVDEVVTSLTYAEIFVESTEVKRTLTTVRKRQVESAAPPVDVPAVPAKRQ